MRDATCAPAPDAVATSGDNLLIEVEFALKGRVSARRRSGGEATIFRRAAHNPSAGRGRISEPENRAVASQPGVPASGAVLLAGIG